MKKKNKRDIVFIIIIILFSSRIINSIIIKSDIYLKYKYGINYNHIRLQKGIPLLPEDFILIDDEYYSNLLVWNNNNKVYNQDKYLHLNKKMTIRNKNLLLEEDIFQYIYKSDDSLTYSLISSQYHYSTPDREKKHILIETKVVKGQAISSDTIVQGLIGQFDNFEK